VASQASKTPAHQASTANHTGEVSAATIPAEASPRAQCWAEGLVIPQGEQHENVTSTLFTPADLETLQSLFSRIRLPWRYFLAESMFLQISIPEIAATVSNSRRYTTDPQERFEATRNFFKTLVLHGPDSPEGSAVIARANQVHRDIGIDPQTSAFNFVLYTLSHGFMESIHRNSRHYPSTGEKLALYQLMRRVGEKMGASLHPTSYADFIEENEQFKRDAWEASSPLSRELARSLLDNALERMPRFMRPFMLSAILSLVSPETLLQLELPSPSQLTRSVVRKLFSSIALPLRVP
jgi:uncharacterized protein (DUF2236 family)